VESVILTREDIERVARAAAGRTQPRRPRASARAGEPGWVCDWRYLFHSASATFIDMRDPFGAEKKVVSREQFERDDRHSDVDLMEIYHRLTRR
jgi:hypothetical protein